MSDRTDFILHWSVAILVMGLTLFVGFTLPFVTPELSVYQHFVQVVIFSFAAFIVLIVAALTE